MIGDRYPLGTPGESTTRHRRRNLEGLPVADVAARSAAPLRWHNPDVGMPEDNLTEDDYSENSFP